jgi:CBS domain-containing protein
MHARDLMTANPACCSPDTPVEEAARLMVENDCGCLPVVEGEQQQVVGVVTDRDIACRCVAEGKDPSTPVRDVMSAPARCCGPDDDVTEVARVMAEGQVRRVPVVDEAGCCVGMIAQADVARAGRDVSAGDVARVVEHISEPADQASRAEATSAGRAVG